MGAGASGGDAASRVSLRAPRAVLEKLLGGVHRPRCRQRLTVDDGSENEYMDVAQRGKHVWTGLVWSVPLAQSLPMTCHCPGVFRTFGKAPSSLR